MEYNTAWIKARLLAGRTVNFTRSAQSFVTKGDIENHHNEPYLFIRINNSSRVRLVIEENPHFWLDYLDNKLVIKEKDEIVVADVTIEEAVVHAPKQLFLGIYEYCKIGCKFCPLHHAHDTTKHYSLDSMFQDIDNSKTKPYTSIGITTAIPFHLTSEDVADEMIFTVRKIREKVGKEIPIGISTRIPSYTKLLQLFEAGASEARLNVEVPDTNLSKKLMPHKPKEEILKSLSDAVDIFGRGKVSSNIVLGIGETDDNVIEMIEQLSQIGVVATLYPYDSFPNDHSEVYGFCRPSAERLFYLAKEHKKILDKYELSTAQLLTMCPACAASHIFPGKDL